MDKKKIFSKINISSINYHSLIPFIALFIVFITFAIIVDEVHLRNIGVHSDYRSKGIASILIRKMIEISRQKGVVWSTLEVRRSNKNAIQLYEKFGFTQNGIRPFYYRDTMEDALIMWARIDDS